MTKKVENRINVRTGLPAVEKRVYDSRTYTVDVQPLLASGDTAASITSVSSTPQGLVTEVSPLSVATGVVASDGLSVTFSAASGTDLEDYKVVVRFSTTNGDALETEAIIEVRG